MKKTIIALLALSGIAMAGTVETDILTIPESITQITTKPDGWEQNIGNQTSITAAIVAKDLKVCSSLAQDGWHWGVANLQNACQSDLVILDGQTGFKFKGRQGYGGEFVAATLDVANLISTVPSATEISQLTFNFAKGSTSQGDLTFSAWHWDGASETATALIAANNNLSTTAASYTWTAPEGQELDSGKILIVFSEYSAGADNTINDFTAKATLNTQSVPEPTTGTLSLLALAGLCARRRKK